jgi:hypothetical protein
MPVGDTSKNTFSDQQLEAALQLRMPLEESAMNLTLPRAVRDDLLKTQQTFARQQLLEERVSAELALSRMQASSQSAVRSPY